MGEEDVRHRELHREGGGSVSRESMVGEIRFVLVGTAFFLSFFFGVFLGGGRLLFFFFEFVFRY